MKNSNEAFWRIDFNPPISLAAPEAEQIRAVFDPGVYSEANDATARAYGHEKGGDMWGRPLKEYMQDTNSENLEKINGLIRNKFLMTNVITKEQGADQTDIVALNNIIPNVREGAVSHIWGTSLVITELVAAQDDLRQSRELLADQKIALEEKNIALKDLISHIELEKKEFQDRILSNLKDIVLPSLERIRLKKGEEFYIEQHRRALESLTSNYGNKISNLRIKLTPRQIEICNLVRNGLANKEIAQLLNIALHTVEKHRRMARKKLGLINEKVNLHSYLNSL